MSRHDQWQRILDLQVEQWMAKSYEQISSQLSDLQAYEIEADSKTYQVEVELVERTDNYVHVIVAVDDGSLPASIAPATRSFIRHKGGEIKTTTVPPERNR